MVFNVMIQLCKITRSSKLFQRNFFLPLLRPLSPKDALRRKVITGQNVLGSRIEHYIPVLEDHIARQQRRKYMVKGEGKKRQRKKPSMRYVMPLFDENLENHDRLQHLLYRKPKGKGQCYTYYIPDKKCTLVVPFQFERAIRDKDILDVIVAQRTEKIVVKMRDGIKVSMPLVTYDGRAPFYRGEGWTKRDIEEYHHHGKETMSIARLFEAKEQGLEEWELEMMRVANKRKRKVRGEGTMAFKQMMETTAKDMDWDNFEEESKQIVAEIDEPVEDEPIAMEVDDMEKTKNVNEKLKEGGEEVLELLPAMTEIPECVKMMQMGEMTEMCNVSGMAFVLPAADPGDRFVPGQLVKSEDGEIFVPGQTIENEEGEMEYTPGFTVLMDGEPTLLPGLVMGDDPNKPMFLPGESTITETGELQFEATEDDLRRDSVAEPAEPEHEVEEVELEVEQNTEDEEEEARPPPPPKKRKELIYERPQRVFTENMGPKRRERVKKAPPKIELPPPVEVAKPTPVECVLYDLTLPTFEKDLLLQEKERVENFTEKKAKEEVKIDKLRRDMRVLAKKFSDTKPVVPKYQPQEPVTKSDKLKELEKSIKKGKFFDVDHKKFLNKEHPSQSFNWKLHEYRHTFDTVGIMRHRVWKSVV